MEKRREQPRLKFDVVVKDTKHNRKGTARNISIDGCFIKKEGDFQELLPVGSPVDLLITLPNAEERIHVSGIVKHHGTQEEGMGIFFEKIDEQSVAIIQEFIKTFLDDLSGDAWTGIREDYWQEVGRLKVKAQHKE